MQTNDSPADEPGTKGKILRAIVTLPIVTVCALASGFAAGVLCVALASPLAPATRDYIFYWATAQQLAHHANPYDIESITKLERAAGLPAAFKIGYTRNPPWALPLLCPLGFFSLRKGWILWYLLLLASLAGSVYLLWILFGRPRNSRYLLGLSFAPALVCMVFGQTSMLVLPGLVLFLRWHQTRPFLAGISLWLCALKPHLFLPFGVVLMAWIVVSKAYKLAAGTMAAIAASCAITYQMAPHAWTQYAQMAHASGIENEQVPCLSSLLRHWLSPQSTWLQYLPAAIGCIWALAYFWPRRHTWDWLKNGSYLLLVSLLVAPYSWIFDHGMVLPALLRSAYQTRSRNLLIALAFLSALIEIALFYSLSYPPAMYLWTIWAAPAWLVWVLIADVYTGGLHHPLVVDQGERIDLSVQKFLRGMPAAERLGE